MPPKRGQFSLHGAPKAALPPRKHTSSGRFSIPVSDADGIGRLPPSVPQLPQNQPQRRTPRGHIYVTAVGADVLGRVSPGNSLFLSLSLLGQRNGPCVTAPAVCVPGEAFIMWPQVRCHPTTLHFLYYMKIHCIVLLGGDAAAW